VSDGRADKGAKDASTSSATIVDVARHAGVSHSTVSRVLNGRPYIKSETRERVERALAELGYVANLSARGLAGGRLGMIGLVVLDLESSYINQVVRSVDAALAGHGHDLLLCTTHERAQRESSYVERLTVGLCDGLLLLLPTAADRYAPELSARGYPFVLIDHKGSQYASSVVARNEQGAFDAVAHLAQLGHHRVAHISGDLTTTAGRDRLAGYRRAVEELELDSSPELTVDGDFRSTSGERRAHDLLDLDRPPTAIFAAADATALGVATVCMQRGVRIPQDLSLIGFDDIAEAALMHPPLTTIDQKVGELGRQGVELLLARLESPERPVSHVELATSLVWRDSTGPRPPGA